MIDTRSFMSHLGAAKEHATWQSRLLHIFNLVNVWWYTPVFDYNHEKAAEVGKNNNYDIISKLHLN